MVDQPDLWGNEPDPFETALERFGLWPVTVWHHSHQDPAMRELKALLKDDAARGSSNNPYGYMDRAVSIFSPLLTAWILNMWGPQEGGVVLDPFAGGGTRAIMSAAKGYSYTGIEIRAEEVAALNDKAGVHGYADQIQIIHGDARDTADLVPPGDTDFILTCPPYYDMEQYGGGPGDLSELPSYREFIDGIGNVAEGTLTAAKNGALSVWVVGLHRTPAGELLPLNHDIATTHRRAGWSLREEVILEHQHNGALQRVGQFDKGRRHLVRVHEYVLVFQKGPVSSW